VGTTITIRLNSETMEIKAMINTLRKTPGLYQNRSESVIALMLLEKPLRQEFKKLNVKRRPTAKG
jgi:hypothetical protein